MILVPTGPGVASKAQSLQLMHSAAPRSFVVDPFMVFTIADWVAGRDSVLDKIQSAGLGPLVIVRSSCLVEDVSPEIPPGLFHSEPDVLSSSREDLTAAVCSVAASYGRHELSRASAGRNEVVVQRQASDVAISGVVASIWGPQPYLYVEYDDNPASTRAVTAGRACRRCHVRCDTSQLPPPWQQLRRAVLEVSEIVGCDALFIEFAISSTGVVHVFQARHAQHLHDRRVELTCRTVSLARAMRTIRRPPSTIWSDMADWNPAEMLGDRPKPLARSLYEVLVTNRAWAAARAQMGYRDLRPKPLMACICGKPYVNLRLSLLSLTPAELPDCLAQKLVGDRLAALADAPELHDKIEFALMFSCADVAPEDRTSVLLERGFTAPERDRISTELRLLTAQLLTNYDEAGKLDAAAGSTLRRWREMHPPEAAVQAGVVECLRYLQSAIRMCRVRGVVPFARQARYAFVARDLMARLCAADCFHSTWLDEWWASVDTVATQVASAFRSLSQGSISRSSFDSEYGHLRARTYDITCARYDRIPVLPSTVAPPPPHSRLSPPAAIGQRLGAVGLPLTSAQFLAFAAASTRQREALKLVFSAVLSDILEALASLGAMLGFDRTDLAFLTVQDITHARATPSTAALGSVWRDLIATRREEWHANAQIPLPEVITDASSLTVVTPLRSDPNFITAASAEGEIVYLADPSPGTNTDLKGRIVVIEAADPGLDWVFAFSVAGLVTRYGGAASHVAVRCAEFCIPAIIGCGEELFEAIRQSTWARIDCKQRRIHLAPASPAANDGERLCQDQGESRGKASHDSYTSSDAHVWSSSRDAAF